LRMPLGQLIQEHAPLDLAQGSGRIMVLLAAGYVVLLAGVFPRWPRVTWLLPLAWIVLAVERVRHTPWRQWSSPSPWPTCCPTAVGRDGLPSGGCSRPTGQSRGAVSAAGGTSGSRPAGGCAPGWPCRGTGDRPRLGTLGPGPLAGRLLPDLKAIAQTGGERPRIFNDMLFGGF